ncbi:MAG TPA: beta-ketoacyl synthase N-terminal-like domain-containing protein, partial [Steroidobacter sp.]|nr:beta-ketoacyl synthase N-terminal-like domain-containing protein [Steroidobacter sp.]
MRRVVVTGMGGLCGLGTSWPEILAGLRARRNAIRTMHEWDRHKDMNTRLAGPIEFSPPAHWTRKQLRSMGRVSQLAVRAAELAIADAGLTGAPVIASGATGVASGSSTGSTADISNFAAM